MILSRRFSSVPMDYQIHAIALDGTQLDGEIEIRGSFWVFPKTPLTQPLRDHNRIHAGFWDTFFRVFIVAHSDLEITLQTQPSNALGGLIGLVGLIIAGVLIIFWLTS
jgi:hypothetical protein